MLSLKQALGLNSVNVVGGSVAWTPNSEGSVVAWYQKGVGITLNGSDVSAWADSANSYNMAQSTASEQPAYSAGSLTFVSADDTNLQTTSQISLTGAFTIGVKLTPTGSNTGTFLADITTNNEFFKLHSTTNFRAKIDGNLSSIDLDSGTFGDDYIIVTRNGSNLLTLYQNGVAQSTTTTTAGTADIDAIGLRSGSGSGVNGYDGVIEEVQIFSSSSTALTANVNAYLAGL
tara:strand:+ start:1512 stop:2204 length:693 start_codon:yes stop_codon:yes gene_type:complete